MHVTAGEHNICLPKDAVGSVVLHLSGKSFLQKMFGLLYLCYSIMVLVEKRVSNSNRKSWIRGVWSMPSHLCCGKLSYKYLILGCFLTRCRTFPKTFFVSAPVYSRFSFSSPLHVWDLRLHGCVWKKSEFTHLLKNVFVTTLRMSF